MTPMAALNRVTDPEAREVLLRLAAEHAQFRGRLTATAGVPCVKDDSWKRYPMKCLPKDPCSFCRAREALRGVDESGEDDLLRSFAASLCEQVSHVLQEHGDDYEVLHEGMRQSAERLEEYLWSGREPSGQTAVSSPK
jgi:hypothetical protein